MELRLLGPVDASHEGWPVALGRRQERLLLAILALGGGQIVATDRLIDLVWGDDPPPTARATLHTYIGRLRRRLEPYDHQLTHAADGYRLEVPPTSTVDATGFRALALASAAATDPAEQIRLGVEALSRWRGELLADLVDDELRERIGGDLSELRLVTAERCARLWLDAGQPEQAADLLALARQVPMRERLAASVMTALYRCERRADAQRLFAETADALATIGIEPGQDLTTLREQIENDDPRLLRPPAPIYAVRVRDQWLPWNTSGHPALEFCNTYAGWGGDPRPGSDWLRSYTTLAVWTGHVDLADEWTVTRLLREAARVPLVAADVLAEARELRRQLYACLTDGKDTAAFKAVAHAAEEAAKVSSFLRDDDGIGRWRISSGAGLRLPVHAAARSAADLLADPRHLTVRTCPGPHCGWLFLDVHGQRRWCSLGTCGRSSTCG